MSSVLPSAPADRLMDRREAPWLVVLAGFAAMYGPVYVNAARGLWQSDDHAHGALVLAVIVWLFWRIHRELIDLPTKPARLPGALLFAFGLALYVVGRVVGISILDMGSQPFVVAGALLLLRGPGAIRVAWFPIVYFIFMIPLPGFLVDAITGPLKQWISTIVVELLYRLGYPIANTGVMLTVGKYELLVADACSGLHSMYSLTALGTLFMYVMARGRALHNVVMLASILPIAFLANIVRVIVLVLVTYHLGNEAGQGFLHGAAGIVLMLVALSCFFALDSLLARLPGFRAAPRADRP